MTGLVLSRLNGSAARVAVTLLRSLGPVGVIAVALLLASAVVALVLTPRLHERSIAMDQALRAMATTAPARTVTPDAGSEVAIFSASLPPIASNAADMNRLFAIAAQTNIKTPKADYRLSKISNSLFLGYEVRIPLTASYPELRRFTAEALHQLPNLAVDAVRFARQDSNSEALDAELRLVLFYRRTEQ